MKGYLSPNRLKYVFTHLDRHIYLSDLNMYLILLSSSDKMKFENNSPRIYFPLSAKELDPDNIFRIRNIPVLFPNNTNKEWYYFVNNNLVFSHDLLKSCFYLLSGFQEFKSTSTDSLNRYQYDHSIQKKLDIIRIPVVNYYFDIIIKGFQEFSERNNIKVRIRNYFKHPSFVLSHDIDQICKYNIADVIHKVLELLTLRKTIYSRKNLVKLCLIYTYNYLFPFKPDPYWNFEYLRKIEKQYNIRSTWFFLEKEGKNRNMGCRFSEKRIQELMHNLDQQDCEIALHGTIPSATDYSSLATTFNNLSHASPQPVKGFRQHYLLYNIPDTALLHEQAGIIYDSTLTFPSQEGFRNSYCFPFKLYDFENEKIINVWEIPLTIMDGTLFHYNNYSFKEALQSVNIILQETVKFNGIFSLLWHNSFFDEVHIPGITQFYEDLIEHVMASDIVPATDLEIIDVFSGESNDSIEPEIIKDALTGNNYTILFKVK